MREIEAVLLDMDGVVIDSEPIHEQAQRLVFDEYRLAVPDSVIPSFKGLTEQVVFERIVAEFGGPQHDVVELIEAKERTYRSLLRNLQLIPGAHSFIRQAHAAYRLALTTSSVRADQRIAFDTFDLHRYFEVVVTAEDIGRPKPHPEPYLVTADKLGVDPSRCMVVEDSLNGVRSAVAAGCYVVGMTTSFDRESLSSAGCHITIDLFEELSILLSLNP